jgi:hypothetical protein
MAVVGNVISKTSQNQRVGTGMRRSEVKIELAHAKLTPAHRATTQLHRHLLRPLKQDKVAQ